MTTNELRQGNWLRLKSDPEIEAIVLDIYGNYGVALQGNAVTNPIEDIEGIPLTSKWLKNAGFNRRDNFAYDFGKLSIVLKGDHGYKDGRTYYNSWAILESQPKYVHSLQNIIYALEGKELIISRK